MPLVDVLDDTFVRARPVTVREQTVERWPVWLPRLLLVVAEDRAARGTRWQAALADDPRVTGSAEVWLEAVPGGTVVHLYVRLGEPSDDARARRRAGRVQDRVRRSWKRGLHRFKDEHERRHEDDRRGQGDPT